MATRRTYGDLCGVARALDLVGERWALLVVRELLFGPKRFTDLRTGITNASPNVLAQRLRELETSGVVRRRKLGPPAGARVYELTEWGRELEPMVLGLGRWGSRSPWIAPDAEMSVDSHIIALRTLFDPGAAEGFEGTFELRLGDDRFDLRIADGEIEIARGDAARPAATIETDPPTLRALLWQGRDLTEAMRSGKVEVEGDRKAVQRLLRLFPRPELAAIPDAPAGVDPAAKERP